MNAKDTLHLKKFPVVVHSNSKNLSRIYPLKQRQVDRICRHAKDYPEIRRIIIFGSSITPKCHIDSDLDICIDEKSGDGMRIYEIQKMIGEICDWNCDIVMYSQLSGKLLETIDKEGVVVYE